MLNISQWAPSLALHTARLALPSSVAVVVSACSSQHVYSLDVHMGLHTAQNKSPKHSHQNGSFPFPSVDLGSSVSQSRPLWTKGITEHLQQICQPVECLLIHCQSLYGPCHEMIYILVMSKFMFNSNTGIKILCSMTRSVFSTLQHTPVIKVTVHQL